MDKPEILERIRETLRELSSGQTIFAANTLHYIENHLDQDVAAEKEAREAVVVNGQVVNWEASAKRYRAKCRQLRAERDAAREQHDVAVQQRDEVVRERDELQQDLDEHKKWNADLEAKVTRLEGERDNLANDVKQLQFQNDNQVRTVKEAREKASRLCDELAELKKNVRSPSDYSDLVTENARLRVALHAERGVVNAVTEALAAEREAHLQLQADRRDPNVDLLAAQFDVHRAETNDELAGHEYRIESIENRLAKLRDL